MDVTLLPNYHRLMIADFECLGAHPKPKLPTEIIGYISEFCNFQTHTAVRSLCSAVRRYIPSLKVLSFEDFKKEVTRLKLDGDWKRKDEVRRRIFQKKIHMDIQPKMLRMEHLNYLGQTLFLYELCRFALVALDNPKDCKGIDILFGHCVLITTTAATDDLNLIKRLLLVPKMDPAGNDNRAIGLASYYGHLAVIQFLLQDSRVDPSAKDNYAICIAAQNGHIAVVQALLQHSRVDPSAGDNSSICVTAQYGHIAVVQALLRDSRVDPSARENQPIQLASENGHIGVMKCLLEDMRVDPSALDNYAIRSAHENGHSDATALLLLDPRVDGSVIGL